MSPKPAGNRAWIRASVRVAAWVLVFPGAFRVAAQSSSSPEHRAFPAALAAILSEAGSGDGDAGRIESRLWNLGRAAVPGLVAALVGEDEGAGRIALTEAARSSIVRVLGRHRHADVGRALEAVAAADVREACLRPWLSSLARAGACGGLRFPAFVKAAATVLDRRWIAGSSVARRLRLLEVLREVGAAPCVPLFVDLCAGLLPALESSPATLRLAEESVAAMIRRDDRTVDRLGRHWRRIPVRVAALLVTGIAASRDRAAIAMLGDVLGRDGITPAGALALAAASAEDGIVLGDRILERIRDLLENREGECRARAAAALGMVHDRGSVEALVLALEDPDGIVQEAAEEALKAIAGRRDLRDIAGWEGWAASEAAWWTASGASWISDLEDGDVPAFSAAVRLSLSHPAFRREFAEAIAPRLDDLDPGVRSLALVTLKHLGGPHAHALLRRTG